MSKYKLSIELIPTTIWYSSLYKIFNKANRSDIWQNIKNDIFNKEGGKCFVCGKDDTKLEAHEFWDYDDKKHIQKLKGIHHLCAMCHKVKHIGLWLYTDYGSEELKKLGMSEKDIKKHFCSVNGCTIKDYEKYEKKVLREYAERSGHEWQQDFGEYSKEVKPYLKKGVSKK